VLRDVMIIHVFTYLEAMGAERLAAAGGSLSNGSALAHLK
jgi:hypothetical protein